jgi:DNA-binding NtrC family response regulator
MRSFWPKPRHEPVKFVYLTGDPSLASDIRRVAGSDFELEAVAASIEIALRAAKKSGARVLVTDAEAPGFTWRDVVATSQRSESSLAVVVILNSFEGSEWAEIIRTRAYDVLVRPLKKDSFSNILSGAHHHASATSLRKSAN